MIPRHSAHEQPNAAAATPLAQVLHPSTALAPNAAAPWLMCRTSQASLRGGKSAPTTSLPLPGELEGSGVGGGHWHGGCSLSGAPLGVSKEDFVPSVSLIVPFYGPTTTNTFGRVIIRLVRVLSPSKVHSTSSVTNTRPWISHRALVKPNNGGIGGGGWVGSVAANVENRGCLSWGGRGWGAYLGLAY
ncbi:hypothetical protein DFP72DRAFT_941878, partial [Ephemerocybe angulata]